MNSERQHHGQANVRAGHNGPVSGISANGPEDHAADAPHGKAETCGDRTGADRLRNGAGPSAGREKASAEKAREENRTVCVGAGCEPGTDEKLRRARL